jgi:transcriptional repressor
VVSKVKKYKDGKNRELEELLHPKERESAELRGTERISEDTLYDLSELFKVFGDYTRIKILYDLFSGEKNVTEICRDLEMNQSAVSHQLKILRTAQLVQGRREGKIIVYALADDHVKTIIAMGIEHTEE